MRCIKTTFKGPTDHHSARIIASTDATRISVHWDYALGTAANHERAAYLLAEKLGWLDAQIVSHYSGEYLNDRYHLFVRKET